MIHPCEASLREEARTSLKTEGSTREAGDPRLKMKSACGSLGLSFCFAFLAPIVGCFVTKPIRLAIDIIVRIFKGEITAHLIQYLFPRFEGSCVMFSSLNR